MEGIEEVDEGGWGRRGKGEKSNQRKERGVDRKKEQKWKTKRVSPVSLTSLRGSGNVRV